MRRWIRRSLIGLFGASVLFGGLAACSHHRHNRGPMTDSEVQLLREKVVERASRELNLDGAQRTRLDALADALKLQRAALLAGTTTPRAEMQSLIVGAQFDRAKAQALVDSKTRAVQEHAPALVTALGDFYDSLRPEQQQKLRDFMERGRHARFGQRWHG